MPYILSDIEETDPLHAGNESSEDANCEGVINEDALWQAWCVGRDPSAREKLVCCYMDYAKALAAIAYRRRRHDQFEFDEYLQFAMVGLLEAIDRYQPEKGVRFKTYATSRVQGSILNGLDRLSERQQQIALRRRIIAERVASLRPDRLSIDHELRLLQELGEIGIGIALSIILDGSGMLQTQDDFLPDNVYSRVELRQLRDRLWCFVEKLSQREREVIELHYLREKKFEEIAVLMQITKGRISQLHRQGLERIRALLSQDEQCDVVY